MQVLNRLSDLGLIIYLLNCNMLVIYAAFPLHNMHTATEWPKFAWKFLLSLFAHNPADTNFVRSSQFNRSFHQPTNYSSLRLNSSAAQISSRRVTSFRSLNFIIISCFLIVTGACSTNTFSTIREKLSPDLSWIY